MAHSIYNYTGDFTLQPTSVVQVEGLTCYFYCQNNDARKLTWSIGGLLLSSYHPPNVFVVRNELLISTLSIPATANYNGTAIQCKAIFLSSPSEFSHEVMLLIQGGLNLLN